MQMNNLKTSGHAVYAIQSHIVFVTKYRHKCITQQMIVSIKSQIQETCKKWRSELLEFNGESDHVHLLISSHPTVALSDLVANLKTVTSRRLRKDYEQHLRQYYWKQVFWSSSYAVFSVGATNLETIIQYIRNQESPSR